MTTPVRLQLSRRKGFDLQALSLATNGLSAVRVSRPGLFGNPFVAHDWQAAFRALALGFRGDRAGRLGAAVALYRLWLTAELRDIDAGKRGVLLTIADMEWVPETATPPSRTRTRGRQRAEAAYG